MATQGLNLIVPGLAAAALALSASTASAQDVASTPLVDLDNNGSFSFAEIEASLANDPPSLQRGTMRGIKMLDLNHDGELTPAELTNPNIKLPPVAVGPATFTTSVPFASADKDGDGFVDVVEQALFQAKLPSILVPAWGRTVKAADADGDARLSAVEWASLQR